MTLLIVILDQMKTLLILAVPKRIVEYSGPDSYDASGRSSRGKGKRGSRSSRGGGATSNAGNEGKEPVAKKSRLSSGDLQSSGTIAAKTINETISASPAEGKLDKSVKDKLPINFKPVILRLFEEFWKLEFDETEVNWAFFAKICAANCGDYKLTAFAESSCSLPVIKVRPSRLLSSLLPLIHIPMYDTIRQERIDNGEYSSLKSFEADFQTMFQNIFRYYPQSHPACMKAVELLHFFDRRWREVQKDFRF